MSGLASAGGSGRGNGQGNGKRQESDLRKKAAAKVKKESQKISDPMYKQISGRTIDPSAKQTWERMPNTTGSGGKTVLEAERSLRGASRERIRTPNAASSSGSDLIAEAGEGDAGEDKPRTVLSQAEPLATQAVQQQSGTHPTQSKESALIFIRGILRGTRRDDINSFFGSVGQLTYIHTDVESRRHDPFAIFKYQSSEEAYRAISDFNGLKNTTVSGGQPLELSWWQGQSQRSGLRDLPAAPTASPARGSMPPTPSRTTTRPVPPGTSAGSISSSARSAVPIAQPGSQLSPTAHLFVPSSSSQRAGTAQSFVPRNQGADNSYSAVLKIDNVNASWNPEEVTSRLLDVLSRVPALTFEPQPVKIRKFQEEVNNSVLIRFNNVRAAVQATPIINATSLNGYIPVRVNQSRNTDPLSLFCTGRIQLDNVDSGWRAGDVKPRGIDLAGGRGSVLSVKPLGTPRYQGTRSYILTFDFPGTARQVADILHGQILGRLRVEATVLAWP